MRLGSRLGVRLGVSLGGDPADVIAAELAALPNAAWFDFDYGAGYALESGAYASLLSRPLPGHTQYQVDQGSAPLQLAQGTTPNGRNCGVGTGTEHLTRASSPLATIYDDNQPYTAIDIIRFSVGALGSGSNWVVSIGADGATYASLSSVAVLGLCRNNRSGTPADSDPDLVEDVWTERATVYTGTTSEVFHNGVSSGGPKPLNVNVAGCTQFTLAALGRPGVPFANALRGDLAAVVLFSGVDDEARVKLGTLLRAYYGIS